MRQKLVCVVAIGLTVILWGINASPAMAAEPLAVGFGQAEITPKVEAGKPVYIAGFGQNRKATGVHDSLMARAVVLKSGDKKIALASIDVVGFFYPGVKAIRQQLPDFHYVLVSSTHNHEGPDTLGLWGPSPLKSGIDPDYMKFVQEQVVKSIREAEKSAQPATVRIGAASDPDLLADHREPYVKHDELVVLQFHSASPALNKGGVEGGKPLGILVQWNCHPETLGSKNTLISADYVGYTVNYLKEKHGCPVAYFSGTVGGMMTTIGLDVKDEQGKVLAKDSYEKTERYGILLGRLADKALAAAKPAYLTPLEVHSRPIFIPLQNTRYQAAHWLGLFGREAFLWTGDIDKAEPVRKEDKGKPLAIQTEVALLRLGQLEVVCIPGEIYPELVLDKVQDPQDPGGDFPGVPIEPALYKQLKAPHRMIIGLANDEIGYILPKRQWDEKPPFCYGRKKDQYGEENSCGPDMGPILCRVVKELAEGK